MDSTIDLIGVNEASRSTGLTYAQLYQAYRRGRIRGVCIPQRKVRLVRQDAFAYASERHACRSVDPPEGGLT